MRCTQILLEGYDLLDIKKCTIVQSVNNHGHAIVTGHISDDDENLYLKKSIAEEWTRVLGEGMSGESEVLFAGYVKSVEIMNLDGIKAVQVTLVTGSYLMDLLPKTECFQDETITFGEILDNKMAQYERGIGFMTEGYSQSIDEMAVQYNETDWKFLKRMAGRLKLPIYAEAKRIETNISLGVELNPCAIELDILEKKILIESEIVSYIIKSRDVACIGDMVSIDNRDLYIYSQLARLEGEELVFTYILKDKREFRADRTENLSICGASIDAFVADVQNDKVSLTISCDYINRGKKWFPYATIYSSPDGTGWYCMPEKGDSVRLYFPSEKENNGYVISSVHVSESISDERSNPNEKSIKTKYGKEIVFKPDSLLITNNCGMSIELKDDEGINILSNKAINIQSEEAIGITSINNSLQMTAQDSLVLQQNESSIVLENDIIIDGGMVRTI